MSRTDVRPLLASIEVPTLVVVAGEDRVVLPDTTRKLASGIEGADLIEYPGAGHIFTAAEAQRWAGGRRRVPGPSPEVRAAAPPVAGWDPALRRRLAVLGLALFVYLTAELFPIGALTELGAGLQVRPATTGLLLTAYAIVAWVTTLPVVWACRAVDRRLALSVSMMLLAMSQVGFGLAPSFAMTAVWRAVAAFAHGLLWSQVPVVAARYAPPGQSGRATATVFVGSSMALVAGAPLSSALAHAVGWRGGSLVLGGAAAVSAVLLRTVLPETPAPRETRSREALAWRPVLVVLAATIMLVIGHYVSYTHLALLLALAGLARAALAPVLAGYGIARLLGVILVGRQLDARAWSVGLAVAVVLTAAVGRSLSRTPHGSCSSSHWRGARPRRRCR